MPRFRKTIKRKIKKYPKMNGGSLATNYGVVILPKGTRLYHVSSTNLCDLPQKPMLFMTYHPSEWYSEDTHVSVIEVQKDVKLLFMISQINNLRIFSSLNQLLEYTNTNLAKMNPEKIKEWIPFLQKEGFDGWLSSIENKTAIEIAIRIDPTILKIVECSPIEFNWKNTNYINTELVPKNWGTKYPLFSGPFALILNKKFKSQIEKYQKQIANEDPRGTAFSIFLENAVITYIDVPIQTISWLKKNLPSQLL